MMSFSTHHLLATFTHKSSVTVAELRDYITRRKNKKISIVKRGKNACTRSRIRIAHNHHDTHKKHNLTKNAVVKFFKKESL